MTRNRTAGVRLVGQVFYPENRKLSPRTQVLRVGKVKLLALLLTLAGAVFTALLVVWADLQHITLSYQISRAFVEHKQSLDLNRKLHIEINNLKSLARLERLAIEKYNMAPPEPEQVVYLR